MAEYYLEIALNNELEWENLFDRQPNKYERQREKSDTWWMQKDGSLIRISNMTDSHLINSRNLLIRAGQEDTRAYKGLCKELKKRNLDEES